MGAGDQSCICFREGGSLAAGGEHAGLLVVDNHVARNWGAREPGIVNVRRTQRRSQHTPRDTRRLHALPHAHVQIYTSHPLTIYQYVSSFPATSEGTFHPRSAFGAGGAHANHPPPTANVVMFSVSMSVLLTDNVPDATGFNTRLGVTR